MKRLLLILLALLFISCDRNPTASVNNKIALNWAIYSNNSINFCYFTDVDDKCKNYNGELNYAYQSETIDLVNTYSEPYEYIIEICNSIVPPLVEGEFITDEFGNPVGDMCESDNNFHDLYPPSTCYEYSYNEEGQNVCYIQMSHYIQYK